MGTLRLGVNIDHIATLRQARYATMPDSKKRRARSDSGGLDL